MSVAVVAVTEQTGSTFTLPAGVADGDLLVLYAGVTGSGIAPTLPPGWTQLDISDGTHGPGSLSAYRVASSEPASYTVTSANCGWVALVRGHNISSPVNGHSLLRSLSVTSPPSTGFTTTVDGCLLMWCGISSTTTAAWTSPAGYALQTGSGNDSDCLATKTQTTQGATGTVTGGLTPSQNTQVALIAIAPAGGAAPVNTVAPVVSGTTHVGSALSTTNGTWTDDGSPTFSYQWQRDNQGGGVYSDISSATSSSYTLIDADDGCNIRCVVTDSTPDGNTSANSNSVGLVTEPVPTNSVAPSVSGSATVGSVLSTTNGTWTHMGGTVATFVYQWTRAGVNISSATSSTYTTVSADIGHAIGCTVTATNDGGSGTPTASSNTITVTSGGGGGAPQDLGALIAAHVI